VSELIIDDELANRLRQIAQQENRPLDAVLRSMLDSYAPSPQPSNWPLEMARMAEADTSITWTDDSTDISERSREILENDFADYLLKRLSGDERDST
jgi:hypothetical protein